MFEELTKICHRPKAWEFSTADMLWADPHISGKMLELHIDPEAELASRNHAFIDRSVEWMTNRFELGPGRSVCDFGCGPGMYTTRLARTGANVTGIDFSPRSIEYALRTAAKEKLEIDYHLQDYLRFSTNRTFDLITLIYLDFCPLSPQQRKMLLDIFHRCLNDNGAVFLDVLSVRHFDAASEKLGFEYSQGDGFWSADPYYAFQNTFKYDNEKVLLDKYTVIEKNRRREIYNWLQCFTPESLEEELHRNGFRIEEYYSDVTAAPYTADATQFAVVLRKQGI